MLAFWLAFTYVHGIGVDVQFAEVSNLRDESVELEVDSEGDEHSLYASATGKH